jgi:hypothetical protein
LEALDRDDEALGSYDAAMTLAPHDARYQWNKGQLALALGHFDEGWRLFEQRWTAHNLMQRSYPQPLWTGQYVEGNLLAWSEQGLGDQIIYSSMMADLRGRARSVCLEVEPRLVPLFARSFPEIEVVAAGPELYRGPVATHTPLASLGRYLRPDWQSFKPPEQGYLRADPARSAELRSRLGGDGRRLIGLSWQSANTKFGAAKTASLRDFAAVLGIVGCRFIDLQYGDTLQERNAVAEALGVEVTRVADIDNRNDIDGLAALVAACDLVVTVSNTTAHLAGALGRPTWVLVPFGVARLWYWFRKRSDSPWYPRAQIRHQQIDQTWSDLVASVAPEIAAAVR